MSIENLTDNQQKFLELLINDTKLSEAEMNALFGDDLVHLRADLNLRRLSAETKVANKNRKNLIDKFKAEETVKMFPLAIQTLYNIMKHGKEHNALQAASLLMRPTISYLEKQGVNIANVEIVENTSEDTIKLMYNLEDYKPSKEISE